MKAMPFAGNTQGNMADFLFSLVALLTFILFANVAMSSLASEYMTHGKPPLNVSFLV